MNIGRIESPVTNYVPVTAKKVESQQEQAPQSQDKVNVGNTGSKEPAVPKKWTIMHYGAADNNLMEDITTDVNEMELVGSTKNMNLISQLDRGGSDCKRYFITKDGDMEVINSPVIKKLGSTNMADPDVMANFIKETMEQYPAEHYALVIADHGGGWHGAVEDESHHGWMSMPTIRKGIEKGLEGTGKKLNVVGFDACLMAGTEVGYELKDVADFMIASQESEAGAGWTYNSLLTKDKLEAMERVFRQRLDVSPREFAKKTVTMAEGYQEDLPTMSAVDLSKMEPLAKATEKLGQAILDTDTPNRILSNIADQTQSFEGFRDQVHFAQQIVDSRDIKDKNLKEAAKKVIEAVKDAVIAEQHSDDYPDAHGLSLEVPSFGGTPKEYKALRFDQDTSWSKAMKKMGKGISPPKAEQSF